MELSAVLALGTVVLFTFAANILFTYVAPNWVPLLSFVRVLCDETEIGQVAMDLPRRRQSCLFCFWQPWS